MSQTTVSSSGQSIAVAGQLADSEDAYDIVSGFNGEATAQIPFGFGLRCDPTATPSGDRYLLPTGFSTVGGDVAGISVFDYNHMKVTGPDSAGNFAGDLGVTGLVKNAGMQVLREGRIFVPVQDTVRPGDRAFCVGIATGGLAAGLWAGSGYGASYHIDCTRQGVFRSGTYTAADGVTKVAILEVDFTNKP
jgi:hypothetical protein